MNSRVTALLLLGVLASDPSSAACIGQHQINRLHPSVAFSSVRAVDVHTAPGQAPTIAFYGQRASGDAETSLWIHRCLDEACSPGTTAKLDEYVHFDGTPQLIIRSNGRPLIVNNQSDAISLFDCADAACTSGVNRILLQVYGALYISAAVRSDGRPVLVYADQYTRTIDMIVCADESCEQSTHQVVAPFQTNSIPTIRMAMTSDDRPIIGRTSFGAGVPSVDLLLCESASCQAPTVRPIANHYGYYLEMAIRSDDRPVLHFSPQLGPMKLVVCNDATCTIPTTRSLTGFTSSGVIMGLDDKPILTVASAIVGYYSCESEDCATQGPFYNLGSSPSGSSMFAALGANGALFVVWLDSTIKLSTATCDTPAIRTNGFEPELDATPAVSGG